MVSLDFGLKTVRFWPLAPASSPRVDASHAWAVAVVSPAVLGPWRCLGTVVASRISLEIHGNSMAYHGFFGVVPCFLGAYELFKQWTSVIREYWRKLYGGSLVRLDGGHITQFAAGPLWHRKNMISYGVASKSGTLKSHGLNVLK